MNWKSAQLHLTRTKPGAAFGRTHLHCGHALRVHASLTPFQGQQPSAIGVPTPNPQPRSVKQPNLLLPGSLATASLDPDAYNYDLVRGARIQFSDSSSLTLRRRALLQWTHCPRKVLLIKKPKNPAATEKLIQIGSWLKAKGMSVVVERAVWATECKDCGFEVFDPNNLDVDFCITLGGDGTVLYLSSLFERDETLPPVLSFSMGSLGFLTPFDANEFDKVLTEVFDTDRNPLHCTLRTRKHCEVVLDGELQAVHHVLNEVVIDRGAFPSTVLLEVFVDRTYVTSVEADGLIIATPSGSTAYSMSAGGPMVAPSVPCTILTPIAPLSLSFRPVIIPESSDLCIHLPKRSRANARASFDGKHSMRIKRDTSLFFSASLSPLPVISLSRMDQDWYDGITSKLKWNSPTRSLPVYPYSLLPRTKSTVGRVLPKQSAPTASYDMYDLNGWQDARQTSTDSITESLDLLKLEGLADEGLNAFQQPSSAPPASMAAHPSATAASASQGNGSRTGLGSGTSTTAVHHPQQLQECVAQGSDTRVTVSPTAQDTVSGAAAPAVPGPNGLGGSTAGLVNSSGGPSVPQPGPHVTQAHASQQPQQRPASSQTEGQPVKVLVQEIKA